MKRRLFSIAAAISLLMCIIVLGAWIRGYWRFDRFEYAGNTSHSTLVNSRGTLNFYWRSHHLTFPAGFKSYSGDIEDLSAREYWFLFQHQYNEVICIVPVWIFLIIPMLVLGAYIWSGRRNPPLIGRCSNCGYDLCATPDRCPECGTMPTKEQVIVK